MKLKNKYSYKLLPCFLIVLLSIVLLGGIVFAETYHYSLDTGCYRFPDNYSIHTDYVKSGTIDWNTPIYNGQDAWNMSSAPVLFYRSSNHIEVHIKSDAYGNTGWYAISYAPYFYNLNTGSIKLNDSYNSDIGSNKDELVSHELGHIVGLLDIDPTYETLMRSSGFNGSATPTVSDVVGVQEKYK